jgi:lysyl endopeptidase
MKIARVLLVLWCLVSIAAQIGFAQEVKVVEAFPEPAWERSEAQKQLPGQNELFALLTSELAPITEVPTINITVTANDLAWMKDSAGESPRPYQVGITKPVQIPVDLSGIDPSSLTTFPKSFANGVVLISTQGVLTWGTKLRSQGATALRVHFTNFYLPPGASLYLYNGSGDVNGPYAGRGPNGRGDFWSHTITGDDVYLHFRYKDASTKDSLTQAHFSISDLAFLTERFRVPISRPLTPGVDDSLGQPPCPQNNASCIQDVSCHPSTWSNLGVLQGAIALIYFADQGGYYQCTGGLITDKDSWSQIPYFLTAHHCIHSDNAALSIQAYWMYQTDGCGSCKPRQHSTTLGATLLKAGTSSDFSLLRLNVDPPAGSYFLGWTTSEVATIQYYGLHRISHPKGSPQAYSGHMAYPSDPWGGYSCGPTLGDYIYSRNTLGSVEGGSSGSPVVNGEAQIVGQLSGNCTGKSTCNSTFQVVDGAFAAYFKDVRQWLDPEPPPLLAPENIMAVITPFLLEADPPTVTVKATDAKASEPGRDKGTFKFTRTEDTSEELTVKYSVSGTATAGKDYKALSGTVTISAGKTSANVQVIPIDDKIAESVETVIVKLAADAAYIIGTPKSAKITIADND